MLLSLVRPVAWFGENLHSAAEVSASKLIGNTASTPPAAHHISFTALRQNSHDFSEAVGGGRPKMMFQHFSQKHHPWRTVQHKVQIVEKQNN